ncbi:MAG: hypothetical protein AAF752_00025 [Bacteroidota bacterium]
MQPCKNPLLQHRAQSIDTFLSSIERYVRFPDTLTADRRSRIAKLIETDPATRSIYDYYVSYYADLDAAPKADPGKLDGFVNGLF